MMHISWYGKQAVGRIVKTVSLKTKSVKWPPLLEAAFFVERIEWVPERNKTNTWLEIYKNLRCHFQIAGV
jgi:hypothetical protein